MENTSRTHQSGIIQDSGWSLRVEVYGGHWLLPAMDLCLGTSHFAMPWSRSMSSVSVAKLEQMGWVIDE